MIEKVFEYLAKALMIFASVVTMVENIGETGEAKKELARTEIKKALTELHSDGKVSAAMQSILANDYLLGFFIDTIVGYANEQGWFKKSYEILKSAK